MPRKAIDVVVKVDLYKYVVAPPIAVLALQRRANRLFDWFFFLPSEQEFPSVFHSTIDTPFVSCNYGIPCIVVATSMGDTGLF